MKLNTKGKAGTTRKPVSHVISVRVNEHEYNICKKKATREQRTMSQMGRILLQKGLADVVTDKSVPPVKA